MLRMIDNHSYDYTPNWTPLGLLPFLIIFMELWIFLVCMLIKISISNFIRGGGGVEFHVNKWYHKFNSKSPIENMESRAFH